jgi:hypothetical protein
MHEMSSNCTGAMPPILELSYKFTEAPPPMLEKSYINWGTAA